MTIREKRIQKGFTSKYVAEYLCIDPKTLTRKERENKFTNKQLIALCKLFEVSNIEELEN